MLSVREPELYATDNIFHGYPYLLIQDRLIFQFGSLPRSGLKGSVHAESHVRQKARPSSSDIGKPAGFFLEGRR